MTPAEVRAEYDARLDAWADELVADWPPLTEHQKAVIRAAFSTPAATDAA